MPKTLNTLKRNNRTSYRWWEKFSNEVGSSWPAKGGHGAYLTHLRPLGVPALGPPSTRPVLHRGDVARDPHGYKQEAAFLENGSATHTRMKEVAALTGKVGSGARPQSCLLPGRGGLHGLRVETDAATTRGVRRDARRCARSVLIYLVWGKIQHKNPHSAPTSLPLD